MSAHKVGLKSNYDWMVLGDHPSALLSGCLAAKLGYSVLFLPLGETFALKHSRSGQLLDPDSNFLIGLGRLGRSNGILAEVLKNLGFSAYDLDLVRSGAEVFPEIVTPKTRINFGLDDELQLSEIDRNFGKNSAKKSGLLHALNRAEPQVHEFLNHYPERFIELRRDRRGIQKLIPPQQFTRLLKAQIRQRLGGEGKAWFRSGSSGEDLEDVFTQKMFKQTSEGLWVSLSGSGENTEFDLMDWILLLSAARQGASFKGGISAYRQFLRSLGEKLGAQTSEGLECQRIFINNGKFSGIQVSQRGEMVSARGGVLGCVWDHAKNFFFDSNHSEKLEHFKSIRIPAGWKYTIALLLNLEALPPGVGDRVVWKEEGAPSLEIEFALPKDYGVGKVPGRMVFIRTVLDWDGSTLEPKNLKTISERMMRQFVEIFPFADFHVQKCFPDFRKEPTPGAETISEVYPYRALSEIPGNLRVYSPGNVGIRSGISGLSIATQESFPGFGSLGWTLAALEAIGEFVLSDDTDRDERLLQFSSLWKMTESHSK